MSKKKSYMDRENILSESLLKVLGNLIPFKDLIKRAFTSKKEKDVLNDPGVKKALKKFNKNYDETMKWAKEVNKRSKERIKNLEKEKVK